MSDSAALAALPAGSTRAAANIIASWPPENLSPKDWLAPSQAYRGDDQVSDEVALFRDRMRDIMITHPDRIWPQSLGELCLLAFMYAHSGNLGMAQSC